jgi:hypothetical protein
MLDLSEEAASIVEGYSWEVHYRLQSFRGEIVLAEDIPCMDVLEEGDATLRVPERLTFTVPVEVDGVSWVPTSYSSPLGCYGQRVLAQIGIGMPFGAVEWLNRGTFLLESADTDGSSIRVEAVGVLQLLDEAELATEFQPGTGATMASTLRQLIEPGITVDLDLAPTDRTIKPSAVTWSDNRLDCVYTILDAWPAQGRIDAEGHLDVIEAPEDPAVDDVVFTFTEGTNGTVMEYTASITRDGSFNAVIAEGQYADDRGALAGLPIVHTALDADPNSPYSLLGEFSPYLVPHKFSSPLLNEHVETYKAAYKKLKELRRRASRTVQISAAPHPGLQLGDAVAVHSDRLGLSNELGRVDAFRLPYSADGGAMEVTVRLSGLI